jgi:trimeric autotransporter adhesin
LGYTGSRGSRLQIGSINDSTLNINQLTADQLTRTDLTTKVANPFFGIVKTGSLSAATVEQRQLLRPFPQFGDVFVHQSNEGKSFYNSVTVKAQKRMTKGMSFLTSYTFSKMLDNVVGQSNFYSGTSNFAVNIYDLTSERGLSAIDTPHRFLFSGSYELPFGKGKSLLSDNSFLDRVVGGWQFNVVGSFQSGFPLSITQASNNTLAYSSGQRPNVVLGIDPSTAGSIGDRIDSYLNPAAFSAAPAQTYGNISRTIGVRSPGQKNWDFGLIKNTTILENFKAQFRIEAINAFNTPIFRAPNTSFGSASFGKITSQANFARVIQLSVRLMF